MNFYCESDWIFEEDTKYLKIFMEKSWQALNKQDEISYATSGIIEMIINFQKNPKHMILLYPEGFDHNFYFAKLLRFYHHNLLIVRKFAYHLINTFLNFNFYAKQLENFDTLKKIAILSIQNLMIEDHKVIYNIFILMKNILYFRSN